MLKFLFIHNFLARVERSNQPHLGWTALAFPEAGRPQRAVPRRFFKENYNYNVALKPWRWYCLVATDPLPAGGHIRGCFENQMWSRRTEAPSRLTLTASEKGESATLR
jgi:hypothetical protein